MAATNKADLSREPEAGAGHCSYQSPPQQPTSYPHPAHYQQTTEYPHPPPNPHLPHTPPQYQLDEVSVVPFSQTQRYQEKSRTLAVILCVPVLGILGLHHFYLNRPYFGYIYAFTLGLAGLGWLIDWFRIGSLVRRCNEETREAKIRGHWLYSKQFVTPLTRISLCDAYMLWLPPFGLFGFYQYYLGRRRYGMYHSFTLGRLALGWLLDFCRLPSMVRQANADINNMKNGIRVGEKPYSLCDAYTLAFPLGIFGLHHFYLGNKKRGILFLCTAGVFGLGWLADMFQMPLIVAEANKNRELKQRLTSALTQQTNSACNQTTTTVVVMNNQEYAGEPGGVANPGYAPGAGVMNEPPPAYAASAPAGETVISDVGYVVPPPAASPSGAAAAAAPDSGFKEVPICAVIGDEKKDFVD